ncbi:MAG: triphosphoribosyl-dephospho-CoA synthase CitG [Clostridiaceae bacterium]|nr:triphosphoribosyl-dephospho-CoA synthase CitG [Clostridiaceae bacterium]
MNHIHERIGSLAARSLLLEVAATPKPGLVDRRNCGSHRDMNFYTFVNSAFALEPHFSSMALEGFITASDPLETLFAHMRLFGKAAEKDMFAATNGVNTHKGALFSLGLLCGALGREYALKGSLSAEGACLTVANMSKGICQKEFSGLKEKLILTKGERMYLQYGVTGARGQAESGFESVHKVFLPYLKGLISSGMCEDEAYVRTLLKICACTEDTNIMSRAGINEARKAMQDCSAVFQDYSEEKAAALDDEFIRRNISPGGCADLLAVTIFLSLL